jgi:hypothetical protein
MVYVIEPIIFIFIFIIYIYYLNELIFPVLGMVRDCLILNVSYFIQFKINL